MDVTDKDEFEEFAPDVIYSEGGLYVGDDDWKIPATVIVDFVESGGVFIVTGVNQGLFQLYSRMFEAYSRDLHFFGAQMMGAPSSHWDIP